MALIKCPDCASEVSDKAASCPRCGHPLAGAVAPPAASPASYASSVGGAPRETGFYADDFGVRVTSARVIFKAQTYSLANVSSVSAFTMAASRVGWILIGGFMGLVGLITTVAGFSSKGSAPSGTACGVVFLAAGAAMFLYGILRKDTHFVRLTAAGGETNAWQSHDLSYIQRIVGAINEAIVRRG